MDKQILDFDVFIEQDEDGIYIAKVLDLDGCYTQGKTLDEVMERIKEAIEVCLEDTEEQITPSRFIGIQKVQVEKPIA